MVVQQPPTVQATVVSQQPVVTTEPPPAPQPYVSTAASPAPQSWSNTAVTPAAALDNSGAAEQLRLLSNPDERVRSDAALRLGRLQVEQAVDPLAATLAGDRSPVVRDAAARALGLIGSPRALTALTHAAQVDSDRDVRRSAQFAVDVIQTNRR
jgi:HEAT repeat protein